VEKSGICGASRTHKFQELEGLLAVIAGVCRKRGDIGVVVWMGPPTRYTSWIRSSKRRIQACISGSNSDMYFSIRTAALPHLCYSGLPSETATRPGRRLKRSLERFIHVCYQYCCRNISCSRCRTDEVGVHCSHARIVALGKKHGTDRLRKDRKTMAR
jgi:hypothetical protein